MTFSPFRMTNNYPLHLERTDRKDRKDRKNRQNKQRRQMSYQKGQLNLQKGRTERTDRKDIEYEQTLTSSKKEGNWEKKSKMEEQKI